MNMNKVVKEYVTEAYLKNNSKLDAVKELRSWQEMTITEAYYTVTALINEINNAK